MPDSDSEKELIAAASRGEAAAFGEIYRRYGDRVYDFAYRMLGARTIAEDVTHEAFVVLIEHPERYQAERGSLLAFLCGVARHHVLHYWRRSETRFTEPIEALNDFTERADQSSDDPLTALLKHELAAKVEQAIAALPLPQREVIVLREYQELSYEEMAAVIGAELNVIKVRLYRARQALAKQLAPYLISEGDHCHELRRSP